MRSILRNCLFLSAIIPLYSLSVISQVKIHERVTIQTNKLGVDTTGKYMPGQKVISPPINKSMQTTGAMITVPESSYVTITVVSAQAASTIDLILRSPFDETIIPNASWNVGATWESPFFSTETVLNVGIFWIWWDHSGYEYGVEMTQVAENEYMLYFEDLGDLYGPYIDYNDLVVDVRLHGKPDHLNVTVDPDSILYGEWTNITAVAIDNEGNEMPLGDNAIMTLSAEPSSIGSFYPSNEVLYSDLRNGYVSYSADQEESTSIQDVVVTVSGEGTSGTAKVVVKRSPCIVMSISSDKIHPGESVDITMQQLDFLGNLMPYPADQYFDVLMNTDAKYGKLRDQSGNEGSELEGVQPFKFIAADSIDVDTTVVEIEAWTWSGGGASSIAGVGVKDTLRNPPIASTTLNRADKTAVKSEAGKPIAKTLPKPGEILAMRNEAKIKCIELAIDRLHKSINDLSSEEKKLKVKGEYSKGFLTDAPSKKSSNATLMKLARLEEKLKKRLAEVKAAAVKYTTAQTNTKDKLMIASEGVIDCRSIVHVMITKEPELIIVETPRGMLGITRDSPPQMPQDEVLKVQLKNFDKGAVKYTWDLTVKYSRPDAIDEKKNPKGYTEGKYEGSGTGNNSEVTTIPLEWKPSIIRGGDLITLHVKAEGEGCVKEKTMEKPFSIFGLNPTKASVKNMLTLEQQVIAYWESGRTFHQFINDLGEPLFYGPHGFGIMMVDPPTDDEQIWNWLANVAEGINRYNEKVRFASNYHNYLKTGNRDANGYFLHPLLKDSQGDWYLDEEGNPISYNAEPLIGDDRLLDILQLYNGGAYWKWVVDNDQKDPLGSGYWDAQPPSDYADRLFKIYTDVKNGKFPNGWNE